MIKALPLNINFFIWKLLFRQKKQGQRLWGHFTYFGFGKQKPSVCNLKHKHLVTWLLEAISEFEWVWLFSVAPLDMTVCFYILLYVFTQSIKIKINIFLCLIKIIVICYYSATMNLYLHICDKLTHKFTSCWAETSIATAK